MKSPQKLKRINKKPIISYKVTNEQVKFAIKN